MTTDYFISDVTGHRCSLNTFYETLNVKIYMYEVHSRVTFYFWRALLLPTFANNHNKSTDWFKGRSAERLLLSNRCEVIGLGTPLYLSDVLC